MQVVWQILKSSLNFMLTEKPRLSHVNFASVLVLFACIVYVDFLNDKWTMSSVICLLSPVSFLLPKTTWLPRLSLGTFASTSLLAVSMFFCMSCQFILAKCNGCHGWWRWWWWWCDVIFIVSGSARQICLGWILRLYLPLMPGTFCENFMWFRMVNDCSKCHHMHNDMFLFVQQFCFKARCCFWLARLQPKLCLLQRWVNGPNAWRLGTQSPPMRHQLWH